MGKKQRTAEAVEYLEDVLAEKERKVEGILVDIAKLATRLTPHCEPPSDKEKLLHLLRSLTEEALEVIHEIHGLQHGLNRVRP